MSNSKIQVGDEVRFYYRSWGIGIVEQTSLGDKLYRIRDENNHVYNIEAANIYELNGAAKTAVGFTVLKHGKMQVAVGFDDVQAKYHHEGITLTAYDGSEQYTATHQYDMAAMLILLAERLGYRIEKIVSMEQEQKEMP